MASLPELGEDSLKRAAQKWPRVSVITTQYSLKIYINNALHLCLSMEDCRGIQSWIDNTGFYCIEYYSYKGEPVLTEYEDRTLWEEILKKLDEKI